MPRFFAAWSELSNAFVRCQAKHQFAQSAWQISKIFKDHENAEYHRNRAILLANGSSEQVLYVQLPPSAACLTFRSKLESELSIQQETTASLKCTKRMLQMEVERAQHALRELGRCGCAGLCHVMTWIRGLVRSAQQNVS